MFRGLIKGVYSEYKSQKITRSKFFIIMRSLSQIVILR